jgi:hypothetical protein
VFVKSRKTVRGDRASGVETEPAEPQQAGTQQRERDVVRQDGRGRIVAAWPDDDRRHESSHAGIDVDHGSPGKVERPHLCEPAAAPDPVSNRTVDDQRPERDEDDVRREPHALDDGPRDQRRGDDRKRPLVAHVQQVGNRAVRLEADSA